MKKNIFWFSLTLLSILFVIGCSEKENFRKLDVHTKEWRDSQTPEQIIELFKQGNKDFVSGNWKHWDFLSEQQHTTEGQHPMAAILSCIDSRVPAEITFNMGIGDLFNARVAGNFVNTDLAGSLEYACKVARAKVIFVMGHTKCGAVKSACDSVQLGNITHLLSNITPAVEAVQTSDGEVRNSKNSSFVKQVEIKNVEMTIENIRTISPILRDMELEGEILIVGLLYDVSTGKVTFL